MRWAKKESFTGESFRNQVVIKAAPLGAEPLTTPAQAQGCCPPSTRGWKTHGVISTHPFPLNSSVRTAIGVDAGGTGTRAVLLDESGRCLALARSGPGNPVSAGAEVAIGNVVAACTEARAARPDVGDPEVVALTMAGVMALGGRLPGLAEALQGAGLRASVHFHADVESAFRSATSAKEGGVLIVGTGATGAAIRDGRLAALRDGLGWLLGDEGSGFWIGREVVRAVGRALDRRGPDTALTGLLLPLVQTGGGAAQPGRDPRVMDLLDWVRSRRPVELSVAASLVAAPEAADDPVARAIVEGAVEALGGTLAAVAEVAPEGPIVLGGSVVAPGAPVGERLVELIGARQSGRPVLRARDGVAGSALLALENLGAAAGETELGRIHASLAGLADLRP